MTVRRLINLFGPMFATTAGLRRRGCSSPSSRCRFLVSITKRGESPQARHSMADSSLTLSGRSLLREPRCMITSAHSHLSRGHYFCFAGAHLASYPSTLQKQHPALPCNLRVDSN